MDVLGLLRTYGSFIRFSHSVFALPFALVGALLAAARAPADVDPRRLDRRGDGDRPQRRHGLQSHRRRALRRAEPAHRRPRDSGRAALAAPRRSRSCWSRRPRSSPRPGRSAGPASCSRRSRWRSSSGTRWRSGSPPRRSCFWVWRWRWRRSAAGSRPAAAGISRRCSWRWRSARWVGGFDILYACQDLDFDRAHGLRSIPVRFGVPASLAISRVFHVVTVASLAALGVDPAAGTDLCRRRRRRGAAPRLRAVAGPRRRSVAGEARLRSQRLRRPAVSLHDRPRHLLARLKAAPSLLTGFARPDAGCRRQEARPSSPGQTLSDSMRHIALAITGASGAIYAVRTLAALLEQGAHVDLVISDYGRRLLRDELGDEASVDRLSAISRRPLRRRDVQRARSRCTATAISARPSPAAAHAARRWRSSRAR